MVVEERIHSSLKCDRYLDMIESPSAVSMFVYMETVLHMKRLILASVLFKLSKML